MGNFEKGNNFDVGNFVVGKVDLLQTTKFYLRNLFYDARHPCLHQKKSPTVTFFDKLKNLHPFLRVVVFTDKPVRIAQN